LKKNITAPSILLLIALVAFPQWSETIFSPTLPNIASTFHVPMNVAQWTMSIYFIAFALGVFFFGRLSDYIGRRRAMLYGLTVYMIGNILCITATEMDLLLIGRFVQAFGASVGSVITQTILRESFTGIERNERFAQISAVLAFTPAIGPLIGGALDTYFGLTFVFSALFIMSILLLGFSYNKLHETMTVHTSPQSLRPIISRLLHHPFVWRYSVLIGSLNGILFSYYTEAPFLFIDYFSLTSASYGTIGIIVALATVCGAFVSKRLAHVLRGERIIQLGLLIMTASAFSGWLLEQIYAPWQFLYMLLIIFGLLFGIGIALPNCLSLALTDFTDVIGSASALFSLSYYILVSIIVYGMSLMHDESLVAMPFYFTLIGILLLIISRPLTTRT